MRRPLMPTATAVWLVDNTGLTFEQIAECCGLHPLEVQSIADGQIATHIVGLDPVANGQLTREEIERCEKDPAGRLKLLQDEIQPKTRSKGPRYTPLSKRQDRPDAIAWLLRYHPELSDGQICSMVRTTKPTILSIRNRTHWNISNIKPHDPVSLGLCSQSDLDEAIAKANRPAKAKKADAESADADQA